MTTTSIITRQLISAKSVALHRVCLPLIEPFRISNGVIAEKDAILIEITTADGVVGWGEASPMSGSFYSDDTPESAWGALSKQLIPRLLDAGEVDATRFYELLREFPGEAFAKAGLESGVWDAYSQTVGLPLCELLGACARPIPSGVAIGIYDQVGELLERVERYAAQGYQRVKIKIQPGWDIEPVAAVRERFPQIPLMVDANASYTIADQAMFRELDNFGLMMIEQPLARDAHEEAAQLQRALRTPLCADESAESLDSLASLIEKRAARIVNIKIQRVGGLSEARLMLEQARTAGLECWVGTMPELGVASAQGLHLAANAGFTYPTDIEASARWYVDDVIEPPIEIDPHGFITLPAGSGTGFSVSREKVEKYSTAVEKFVA
ncbi:MAG: o-succinylbenzoate synthase [Blastocatellia bacterium]|nr:o-succinylbenzoate synthase [Blastocatellia bacterium]